MKILKMANPNILLNFYRENQNQLPVLQNFTVSFTKNLT